MHAPATIVLPSISRARSSTPRQREIGHDGALDGSCIRAVRPSRRPPGLPPGQPPQDEERSEEHTSELQSLMRISYAVFCLKKKKKHKAQDQTTHKYVYITTN